MAEHHSKGSADPLSPAIEAERRRLQRALSVLSCVAVALDYDGWTPRKIDYADAIDVACALVNESLDGLDAINLGRR